MTSNNVISTSESDTESSTGSNSVECNNTIAIVSKGGHEYECTSVPPPTLQTHKPKENLKNSSFKPNTKPDFPSSSQPPKPLAITSNKTAAAVVTSRPPPPKPGKTTTVVPLPQAPKRKTTATGFPLPPALKPKNTTALLPSPSAPKPKITTAVVPSPSAPQPSKTTAVVTGVPPQPIKLPMNTYVVQSRPNLPISLTFPKPHGEGSSGLRPYGVTASNPFCAINGAQNPLGGTSSQLNDTVVPPPIRLPMNCYVVQSRPNHPITLTFPKPHGEGSSGLRPYGVTTSNPFCAINGAQNPLGGTASQLNGVGNNQQPYHTYLRQMNHPENHNSPRRTIDFFSQKEESTSAQRQAPREIPPNDALEEWGAMLRLGKEN